MIPIQVCERRNLRQTADGDFADVSGVEMDIDAGQLMI
jgi:hypothetical protein